VTSTIAGAGRRDVVVLVLGATVVTAGRAGIDGGAVVVVASVDATASGAGGASDGAGVAGAVDAGLAASCDRGASLRPSPPQAPATSTSATTTAVTSVDHRDRMR
jgi:hypothetical protein